MSSFAITEAITTLTEAEQKFKLIRTEDPEFFREWYDHLPLLTATDKTQLDQLRQRYLYQRKENHLLEASVIILFASSLLAIAGFFDPLFKIRSEESIQLILNDGEETLRGRLDILVLKNQL